MSEDIKRTIEAAKEAKRKTLQEEEQQKIARKESFDKAFGEAKHWMEKEVMPAMHEFENELANDDISSTVIFNLGNPDSPGIDGPSATFRIDVDKRHFLTDGPLSVSFAFRGTEEILIIYGDSSGTRLSSNREPLTCKTGWTRDAIKRQIDPLVETYFKEIWQG